MSAIVGVMMNRRELLSLVLTGVARAATSSTTAPYRVWEQRYRANAVILFCGVQIFAKSGVGGGYAVVEEARRGDSTEVALQFAGGSWPEKAHGVNRLGFIQETVTEAGEPAAARTLDATYFGFMTSSAEKNFEQARQSLQTSNSFQAGTAKPQSYTATEGRRSRFSMHHLFFSQALGWNDCPTLIRGVREAVDRAAAGVREPANTACPTTFLNAVRRALLDPAPKTSSPIIYNGKQFQLTTEKQPEAGHLTRLNGTLHENATGQRTPFRLWYDNAGESFLPVRIEYRAKSFLKLVFEADNGVRQPPITFFLNKETA